MVVPDRGYRILHRYCLDFLAVFIRSPMHKVKSQGFPCPEKGVFITECSICPEKDTKKGFSL
jgi:hypothetical protein